MLLIILAIFGAAFATSQHSTTISYRDTSPACIPRSTNFQLQRYELPLCSLPIDKITSGRPLSGSSVQPTTFPSWFNLTLAQQGQAFCTKNKFSVTIGALFGLLAGFTIPDALDVLSFTNMSDTKQNATKSITNVRTLHINAATKANAVHKPINNPDKYRDVKIDDAMWKAIAQDLAESDVKFRDYPSEYKKYDSNSTSINQFMQGITLFQFSGFTLMNPSSVYIYDATENELNGYLHLWAVIGYALGVEDPYNVCLQKDIDSAKTYFNEVRRRFSIPSLFTIDKIGKVMVEAFLDGVNSMVPGIGMRPVMYRLLRDYFKIPAPHTLQTFNATDLAAQHVWDNIFVPSTHTPATRCAINTALESGTSTYILTLFGPYITTKQKAEHVFFPISKFFSNSK